MLVTAYPTGENRVVAGDYPRNRNSLMNNASPCISPVLPLYYFSCCLVSSGFANLDWPVPFCTPAHQPLFGFSFSLLRFFCPRFSKICLFSSLDGRDWKRHRPDIRSNNSSRLQRIWISNLVISCDKLWLVIQARIRDDTSATLG